MFAVCLFPVRAQTVIETESSILFNETSADVALRIENPKAAFDAPLKLELLDAAGEVRGRAEQTATIETGRRDYRLTLPVGELLKKSEAGLAWFRLRYRVGAASGVVSVSQMTSNIFELRVIASGALLTGMNYRSRIRALNPFTQKPVAGVTLDARLELGLRGDGGQKLGLDAAGETDADGFADLDFRIPIESEFDGDGELRVTGRKNGLVREAADDVRAATGDLNFLMLVDKPIYQPGQSLDVRGLLLKGGEGKTVAADREVEFRVEDEDDTVLYRERVRTSAFGIAAISWKIPENAKLGDYLIRVKNVRAGDDDNYIGYQKFKVSRYDLPNFVVNAKALKPYYLPNEKEAEVEVSADYLFGRPVTKGKVRVVRETSREWNWKEQKYDIKEGESHEGKTDDNGKFTARFDLGEDFDDLDDSDKFDDLHLTAYLTDLTTNRTEQRRFDVRVTREPIHVYLIKPNDDYNPNLPVKAYVSTFYADGSPAACDVELKGREEDSDQKFRTLQKIRTNSYGAGKIEFKRPKFEDESDDLEIQLVAKDKNGLKGTYGVGEDNDESLEFDDDDVLRIVTDRTIYKPGEPIGVELESTVESGLVYVDVVSGFSVVESRAVRLTNHRATLEIPYRPEFRGEIKLAAFLETDDDELIGAARGVIFPAQTNLRVDAAFDREYYKPGEAAKVGFGVFDAAGGAVEAALGVVVFDKAVEERARTDADFDGMFSGYRGWLGYGKAFGGVNIKDLNDLDLTKPVPDELQTVAEVMLYDTYYSPNIFHSSGYSTDAKSVYNDYFRKQFEPFEKMLKEHYAKTDSDHPTDDASLRKILRENRLDFDALRDPWEQPYRAVFETEKMNDVVRVVTAGPDKTFGTDDDFTVSTSSFEYFTPTGKTIDRAVENYHKRTGGFIRDEKTLLQELGVKELKDRFGRPYQFKFDVSRSFYTLTVRSIGKDGQDCSCSWKDDFEVWTNRIDYFADTEAKIAGIVKTMKDAPANEADFKARLLAGGVDFDRLRDGYGENLYLVKVLNSRYADKKVVEKVRQYGETTDTERTVTIPVTQDLAIFYIRGKGSDRRENTYDDVTFAQFNFVLSERSRTNEKLQSVVIRPVAFRGGTGSIGGKIVDPSGAAVTGATVTATDEESKASRGTTSNDAGNYLIANLPAGRYSVKVEYPAFKNAVRSSVPVNADSVTKVDFVLEVAGVSEVVSVDGTEATATTTITAQQIEALPKGTAFSSLLRTKVVTRSGPTEDGSETAGQKSTPRLREYFPETLFWSPEVSTDGNGRAAVEFKMADNITTWKLYTIASTKNGKIGVAEKEIAVFQPFFVDLDPPRFLTDGDEIRLPAQIRNYTETKQKVAVKMAKSDWFAFLGPDNQAVEVDKNAAANAVFGFRAIAPVKDGKQRVTAVAAKDSDAIEKPVTVRPNGREIVATESKIFAGTAQFALDFPADALPKTPRAELKIYPNLMAHVADSVEGLLERPYGCGEQTISSTYPNLMILKFAAAGGKISPSIEKQARGFLQKGFERLLGYQMPDGGFSYWGGKSESDVALTAYAIRFLSDARRFVEVDPKTLENARGYLAKEQLADGRFTKKYYGEQTEDPKRTQILTAYVARTLAMLKAADGAAFGPETDKILDRTLGWFKPRVAAIDEPYALALYGLASADAGHADEAGSAAARLRAMAKNEGGAAYWNLETNTPFYGWGTAGRIETTALVLQLLIKTGEPRTTNDELISKATLFLLKNKDRYGVWYSTQTTVNVLDAFIASLTAVKDQTLTVSLNGEKIAEFAVAADRIEPFVVDLGDRAAAGGRLEIAGSEPSKLMAQLVRTHYVDWKQTTGANGLDVSDSRAVRLAYRCDKTAVKIMETVNCTVEAERVGFRGYGMLLAEIGLPPGADVSRESLEKAFAADWSLSRYDILPDRIVVYMWARAGGTKFDFSFRPRYAIDAQTPASILYDYYNPEAKATLTPLRFTAR
ncbi:MAG: carboxypeptidase regulatory-like domain-containing protein [Acidobacteria bacterium]|nr:carboxypeptidase regulatory-like domain-containing protein [Acidobacteriota bacterium]